MLAYSLTGRLIRLSYLWGFSLLLLLGLAACNVTNQSAAGTTPNASPAPPVQPTRERVSTVAPAKPLASPIPPEPLDPITAVTVAPTVAVPTPVSDVAATGAWQTYRNDQAGYSVDYPADWTVSEQAGGDGSLMTTFAPPGGGAGVTVLVQAGEQYTDQSDILNTRCQQVVIGGLSGTRCFDTISFSTSTTLVGEGKSYTIATSGKHMDTNIYQRFLDTFAIIP